MKVVLTKAELAEALRVSVRSINKLQNIGLPRVKIGTSVRYELAAVLEWLRSRSVTTGRGL